MNVEVQMTLDDAVVEVLGMLTGLDLSYDAEYDRYRSIVRQLNRALRANALEHEWGFYASEINIGTVKAGDQILQLPSSVRPRIINDDAVRLKKDDSIMVWAYFLPRESLSKYEHMRGLWCSVTRQQLMFNRKFVSWENGLEVYVPVMREPRMFRLPPTGEEVSDAIRNQLIDFDYPDIVIARAAWNYAQTDPIMQPRVQTLETNYKDLMYQVIERDTRNTDMPYSNQFILPVENGLVPEYSTHLHPHSN